MSTNSAGREAAANIQTWPGQVITEGGAVTVAFPGRDVVLDPQPVRLHGRTTVWVDPADPSGPVRIDVGDVTRSAATLWALLGREAFQAVSEAAAEFDTDIEAGAAGGGTRGLRDVVVATSPRWSAICDWAVADWLQTVPSRLDPALLEIDAATAASEVADLLDHDAMTSLTESWRRNASRLTRMGRVATTHPTAAPLVAALARSLTNAAAVVHGEPDPRFEPLHDLAGEVRGLLNGPANDGGIIDPERHAAALTAAVAEVEAYLRDNATVAGSAPALIAGVAAGMGTGTGTGEAGSLERITAPVDWALVPARTLQGLTETAVTAVVDGAVVRVRVVADPQAVRDGRWDDTLAFSLVNLDPVGVVGTGALVPDVSAGEYVGEFAWAGVDRPGLSSQMTVDVFRLTDDGPPVPLSEATRHLRRGRRQAAMAVILTRRSAVSQIMGAPPEQLTKELETSQTGWMAAAASIKGAKRPDLAELCTDHRRRLARWVNSPETFVGAVRVGVAELTAALATA